MEFGHVTVLKEKTVQLLHVRPNGIYADLTIGGGGHSELILQKLTAGKLIGIDQDEDAINACRERFKEYKDKLILVHDNFRNIKEIVKCLGFGRLDGVIMDLGVSSHQLDEAERGFSYMQSSRLDMRMDKSKSFSAYDVVNGYGVEDLTRIISEYGEERWAKRIAEFIVKRRPIETTAELVSAIKAAVPKAARAEGIHPAKRTFQAIRIEVNNELGVLEEAIGSAIELLNSSGVIAVITFHSLEDRIVKNAFSKAAKGCICPPSFPVCVCGRKPLGKVITKKPVLPDESEIRNNPRSRSAKLRAFEKF